jgi:hypothetical protein
MRVWLALLAMATIPAQEPDLRDGLDHELDGIVTIEESPPNLLLTSLITHSSSYWPRRPQRVLLRNMLLNTHRGMDASADALADDLAIACECAKVEQSLPTRDQAMPWITDAVDVLENARHTDDVRLAGVIARCGAIWEMPRLVRSADRALALAGQEMGWQVDPTPALMNGILDVAEATGEPRWLRWAVDIMDRRPWNPVQARWRASWGAVVIRLGFITGDRETIATGHEMLAAARGDPPPAPDRELLLTLVDATRWRMHLTVVGRPVEPGTQELLAAGIAAACQVDCLVIDDGPDWTELRQRFPSLPSPKRVGDAPTAYLTDGTTAFQPLIDAAEVAKLIRSTLPSPPVP